jgi:hypothetical protein
MQKVSALWKRGRNVAGEEASWYGSGTEPVSDICLILATLVY